MHSLSAASPILPSPTSSLRVSEELREAILSGEFGPGQRLRTASLATRFGSSRTPVREALVQLEGEGLVDIEPRRGALVRPFASADLIDLYEIRVLLEPAAAARAALRVNAEQLDRLAALVTLSDARGGRLAGPFVGTLLADFGADVVKVEAPPAGDPMREWGQLRHNDHSLWWSVLSRNKRSVALNLREPRGQEIAAELCASADVIIENFRPGTMERWGLGPEQVHAVNPGCIYARVSGYGQSGSYRDRAGFAAGGEAIAGLRYINGYPDQAPPRTGISLGDTLAAQSAFQGIGLALYAPAARRGTRRLLA